ncbi:MAG: lauroyl acyltransferase [Gammaproteobacteria bacterium]|jgi:KDO2-lipid IV(A) lauroyltransferase
MPKLFLGNSLKKVVDRAPALRYVLWGIEALLMGVAMGTSALLPPDRASATGRRLFRAIGPHLDKTRKFRTNLTLAFPDKSPAAIETLIRDSWGNIGAVLAEYPHLKTIHRAAYASRLEVIIKGDSEVFQPGGPPAVFVAGHLANWEVPAGAAAHLGIPLSVIYTPLQNPWLNRLLYRARAQMGCGLIARDGALRGLMQALDTGQSVGLLVDQRVDSGEMVPFFGIDKLTSTIPARLALRYHCDLIPTQVERLENARFRVTFHDPVTPPADVADEHQKILDMTRTLNRLFETWITAAPQDWLCSKRLWPKGAQHPDHRRDKVA